MRANGLYFGISDPFLNLELLWWDVPNIVEHKNVVNRLILDEFPLFLDL